MSAEVVERVNRAIEQTRYQPNRAAQALRTGRSRSLGLIVPDITNPFFSQLAQAVEARARAEGYATVLMESGYDAKAELQSLEFLTTHHVDGLVWIFSGERPPSFGMPAIPTVVVDYAPSDWVSVRADDYGGGRMLARFALEAGHCNVLLVWGLLSVRSIQERRRGFYDESAGALEVACEIETPFSLRLPKAVERQILSRAGRYSLVICGNDVLAIGTMRCLKRAGIDIPGEVSVIGFDDTPLCEVVDPPLSSIAQPTKKLGGMAVNLLLGQIAGHRMNPNSVIVPVTLVERGSTRRINDRE